jgi:hypothetical protein
MEHSSWKAVLSRSTLCPSCYCPFRFVPRRPRKRRGGKNAAEFAGDPRGLECKPKPTRRIAVIAFSEPGIVFPINCRIWQHEAKTSAFSEIEFSRTHGEQCRQILVCRYLRTGPQSPRFTQFPEDILHIRRHMPVGEPRWISDQYINAVALTRQP